MFEEGDKPDYKATGITPKELAAKAAASRTASLKKALDRAKVEGRVVNLVKPVKGVHKKETKMPKTQTLQTQAKTNGRVAKTATPKFSEPIQKEVNRLAQTIAEQKERGAVEKDGLITEYRGTPTTLYFGKTRTTTKDAKGKQRTTTKVNGAVTFRSPTGTERTLALGARSDAWEVYKKAWTRDGSKAKMFREFDSILKGSRAEQERAFTSYFKEMDKELLFRAEGDSLFAVVTPTWRGYSAEDLNALVKATLPGATLQVIKNNGRHGGTIRVELKSGNRLWTPSVFIDTGEKNGAQGLRVTAQGFIPACKNQLTFDVQKELASLIPNPHVFVPLRRAIHTQGTVEKLAELLTAAEEGVGSITAVFEKAKKITLKKADVESILNYYVHENRISDRTAKLLVRMFLSDESLELQQDPDTVYGLAMLVTFAGADAHTKELEASFAATLKTGVKEDLRRVGAELCLVAGSWDKFMTIVEKKQPKKDARIELKLPEPKTVKAKA